MSRRGLGLSGSVGLSGSLTTGLSVVTGRAITVITVIITVITVITDLVASGGFGVGLANGSTGSAARGHGHTPLVLREA